jgi:hypothetical protein
MKFRPHRGSLAAAMAECVDVDGRAGLIEHLKKTAPEFGPAFDAERFNAEPYGGDDSRIGWKDVHVITVHNWGVVGFCEGRPQ